MSTIEHESREILAFWRYVDPLSVLDAAALIAGYDPQQVAKCRPETNFYENFEMLYPIEKALQNAVLSGKLPAKIRREAWVRGWDEEPEEGEQFERRVNRFPDQEDFPYESMYPLHRGVIFRAKPGWDITTIAVDDLRDWLTEQQIASDFFFPDAIAPSTSLIPITLAIPLS